MHLHLYIIATRNQAFRIKKLYWSCKFFAWYIFPLDILVALYVFSCRAMTWQNNLTLCGPETRPSIIIHTMLWTFIFIFSLYFVFLRPRVVNVLFYVTESHKGKPIVKWRMTNYQKIYWRICGWGKCTNHCHSYMFHLYWSFCLHVVRI